MFQVRSLSGTERRTAPRQVAYRLDMSASDGAGGCVLDISTAGMRVRFKRALDVGALTALHIEFPRWLDIGTGLDVRGRFVWVRSTETGGTEAGFAFDDLGRKERSVLHQLIHRLGEALSEDRACV